MSYIEKEKLIKADIESIENRVRHAFNQGYDLGFKEGKERAKPQEQEPTTRNCFGCKYSKDNHITGTEECHLCMWENQYTPTTKNDLGVDKEQLKTMIRGLTKWYVKRDNTEVGEPDTAVGLLYDDVMFGIDRLTPVTPQEPRKGNWISIDEEPHEDWECDNCSFVIWADENIEKFHYCPNCGAKMVEPQESEDKE